MVTFFNWMGYTATDPLDRASSFIEKLIPMVVVNTIITAILLYFINDRVVIFQGFTLFNHFFSKAYTIGLEFFFNTLVLGSLLIFFRKSSTFITYLIVFLTYYLIDIFIEAHYRDGVNEAKALWLYNPASFISAIHPPALKFLFTISVDALLIGIVGLYLTRLLSAVLYRKKNYPIAPTKEQFDSLFNEKMRENKIAKPARDLAFYMLRLLGFIYLTYLALLLIGLLGISPFPKAMQQLLTMTYENPALAINTYVKIGLMILLSFMGAYNKNLRFYTCLCLLTGHLISTIYSLVFHFLPNGNNQDFLLTSAIADGVMVVIFAWIMIKNQSGKYKNGDKNQDLEDNFPVNFSTPMTLSRILFKSLTILLAGLVVIIILLRLFTNGESGLSVVWGSPDPMIGNTLTFYSTLSLFSFLLVKRVWLRSAFVPILLTLFSFAGIISLIWGSFGIFHVINFYTRNGNIITADWYFIWYAFFCLSLVSVIASVRKIYYKNDYALNTLNASSAENIMALGSALFDNSDVKYRSELLHLIDQYIGGLKGRKRGLLNLPFGVLENIITPLYGLHPLFSTMSIDEQQYFLSKYIFQDEFERKNSFVPLVADVANQIGLSLNAMMLFANYSVLNERHKIGYVPADARDRLQGDCATQNPPFIKIADLPKNETDPNNFKPTVICADAVNGKSQLAPRLTTPYFENQLPDEVDYLIIGSGAGGATMAYRLACSGQTDPAKILVIERGNRYQPLQDFNDLEIDMMKKIYKEGGLQQTKNFDMSILQGECVGGTTVANNAVCYAMPISVKANWQEKYEIDLSDLQKEYNQIQRELHIAELSDLGINQVVKDKFVKAVSNYNTTLFEKIGDPKKVLVNHWNNQGDGNWNLGNKRQRKRSMLETYLPWAEARGVKIISNYTAVRFITTGKKADAVILRADNGELRKVRVKKGIIVAGGVIASSHFLMRSDVKNANIGKKMSCNFAFPITYQFEEEIRAYDGDQITMAAEAQNWRTTFETYFNPPASFALASVPFFFDKRNETMKNYANLLNFGALIGSKQGGEILEKPDILNGKAFTWKFMEADNENDKSDVDCIKFALKTLIRLGEQADCKNIILPTKPGIMISKGAGENFIKELDKYPLRLEDLFMGTAHPQGGNMMAGETQQQNRVVDLDFKVADLDNVFVADASIFPTSITVNPQWTIMALSSMAAQKVLQFT